MLQGLLDQGIFTLRHLFLTDKILARSHRLVALLVVGRLHIKTALVLLTRDQGCEHGAREEVTAAVVTQVEDQVGNLLAFFLGSLLECLEPIHQSFVVVHIELVVYQVGDAHVGIRLRKRERCVEDRITAESSRLEVKARLLGGNYELTVLRRDFAPVQTNDISRNSRRIKQLGKRK